MNQTISIINLELKDYENKFHLKSKKNLLCSLDWVLKSEPSKIKKSRKVLSVVDLFCGCGGMTLGITEALNFNNLGIEIKLAVDTDEKILETYKKNFNVNNEIAINKNINELVSRNITKIELNDSEKSIKKNFENIDLLVAGPPCQGHSNLNNHTRGNDPRNDLYFNVIRFIEITKPKVAIIENVETITRDEDNIIEKSKRFLEKNYNIEELFVDISEIGLPQTRKRHILIAVQDKNFKTVDFYNEKNRMKSTLSDFIGDIVDENKLKKGIFFEPSEMRKLTKERVDYLFENNIFDLPDSKRPNCHKNKKHTYTAMYGRLKWDKPAQTITRGFGSMGQGRFVHPIRKRVITPHEAARIQGFPDFFDFTEVKLRSKLHLMIANAVPPRVVALIINSLIQQKILK